MLDFDLVEVAKALAQFKYSSGVLMLIVKASQEAIEQFEQVMEAEEAFLGHCSHLGLDFFFGLQAC